MSVRYAILGLLHYKEMHGYQIKDHIEKNFGYMWSVNFGQIYQTLKALEDEKLVAMAEFVPSDDGGPYKKRYSITPEGKVEFSRWLSDSPERQMLLRDPFLMRFIFFGFGRKADALRIIDEQILLYEQQLESRLRNRSRWEKRGMYVRMIADLGYNFNEMYLAWLRKAREEILLSNDENATLAAAELFS